MPLAQMATSEGCPPPPSSAGGGDGAQLWAQMWPLNRAPARSVAGFDLWSPVRPLKRVTARRLKLSLLPIPEPPEPLYTPFPSFFFKKKKNKPKQSKTS